MRAWDADRLARAAGASVVRPPREDRGGAGPAEPVGLAGPAEPAGPPEPAELAGPAGVSIDSRAIAPGELFVGLPGERADGGEYAAMALRAGAWGVLVAPEHARAQLPGEGAVLAHADPLAGLQALAGTWLDELRVTAGARVVAVTGSTGKTSTKDILAALLAPHLRTCASPANRNTEVGMPLAILAAPAGTRALVLEMAMRGPGQIAELARIARPEVGLIVNVGPVHLQQLGSLAAIAAAKAELIAGLDHGAVAIVPADEPLLAPHLREDLHTITFGPGGDVQLAGTPGRDGSVTIVDATSVGAPRRIVLRPSFAQAHNLRNLLAAVAAARLLGVTPAGEVNVRFSALRGERARLAGEIVLIDDCYNANPMSMSAALDDLAETARGRRVAVLGDMLELGPDEQRWHRELGTYARARGVDVLVTVGPLAAVAVETFAAHAHAGAGAVAADAHAGAAAEVNVHTVADADAAAELLSGLLAAGDTVLVKGSRGVGLERVGERLRAGGGASGPISDAAPALAQVDGG